ncbi:DEAD/DEAH box helicase family protein [Parabacteroides chinchillae]
MNQYTISKGQKLSDIMTEIEPNINLAKKFPGIGATYLEIHSHRPSILIEPNVPVIQGKCAKSDDDFKLFGVYEGVSIDAITRYLQEPNSYHKLMTTPESFQKVKQAVNNVGIDLYSHFFCLMDESHLLVKDVDYRENIVLPMNDFFLFKQKALVSATPIALSDPRFKTQGFRTVTIDADYDYRQEITVIHSNNSLQSIREYLQEHDTPVCFFINLVDYSHSLIKELGIENESSIFCAPKSALKLKHELNFHNAYDEWRADRMRSFNFFTSRFYNAFDLELDYLPHVVMLTDIKASAYTMLDIHTDCVQIAGRFRNGLESLTHIYTTDHNLPTPNREEIRTNQFAHEHAYNTIRTLYNSASSEAEKNAFGEAMRSLPFNKMLYPDGKKNYFAIDNDTNDRLMDSSYHDSKRIEALYYSCNMFKPSCMGYNYPLEIFNHLQLKGSKMTVREKRKKMVACLSEITEPLSEFDMDYINEMRKVDSLLIEAYELLGLDAIKEMNYSQKRMNEAVILKQVKGNKTVKLVKNSFKVGNKYKCSEIVSELTRIFELLNIHPHKTIRGETIQYYFDAIPCKIGKKRERGYYLTAELL